MPCSCKRRASYHDAMVCCRSLLERAERAAGGGAGTGEVPHPIAPVSLHSGKALMSKWVK